MATENEWRKQYLCDVDPPDPKLIELANEYHATCEAYDRTVCTGPMGEDGILPSGGRELALINRNAGYVRSVILRKAGEAGISVMDMSIAIRRWRPSWAQK